MNCNIMPKEMNIWTICDLFCNNFNLRLGETCVGASRASLIRLLQISHKINIMVFDAYLLERQFWCCPGVRFSWPIFKPHRGVSAAFPKQNDNLRSGPIWQGLMHFFLRCPLKLGLIQTLTSLWLLRPDFGRNADWLIEPWHKIWLAAVITGSWKHLFLLRLFSQMIRCQRWEGFCCLFYCFTVFW